MCYFDQTLYQPCGWWRWTRFREQCPKEYRIGETCGLKLVYQTVVRWEPCKLCIDTDKKRRRLAKMKADIARWEQEGNRTATIARTKDEAREVKRQIERMEREHEERKMGVNHQVRTEQSLAQCVQTQPGCCVSVSGAVLAPCSTIMDDLFSG